MAIDKKTRSNLYIPHSIKQKMKYLTAEEKGLLFDALLDYSICGEKTEFNDRLLQTLYEEYVEVEEQNAKAWNMEYEGER